MSQNSYQVAKRYGKALFELAEEEQALDAVFHDVQDLREQLKKIPELESFLNQASVEWSAKKVVLDELTEDYLTISKRALAVIGENHRMPELIVILEEFEKRFNAAKGIVQAQVTTVIPLTETQRDQLIQKLKTQFHCNVIQLKEKIDPTILGGVVVQVGHQRLDGSLRTQLNNLKKELSR